jgi:hypothetical protein
VINSCIVHISDRQKRKGNQKENINNKEEESKGAKQTETMMIYAEVEKAFGKDKDDD